MISVKYQQGFWVFCNVMKNNKAIIFLVLLSFFQSHTAHSATLTYDDALALKGEGNYAQAEQVFLELIRQDDKNVELWFQLGLVQRFQKQRDVAMVSQIKAMQLSMEYQAIENADVKIEIARLHYWNGDVEQSVSMINEMLAVDPDNTEAHALYQAIQRAKMSPANKSTYPWQLDLGYELSTFSRRPQPDWHNYSLQLGRWFKNNTLIHLRTEKVERFHITNHYYEVGAFHQLNKSYNAYLNVGYTSNSTFIPEWRIKTGGEAKVIERQQAGHDVWLTVYLQHDRYTTLNTTSIKPGIRYAVTPRWQLHGQYIHIIDENNQHLQGWSMRTDWQTPITALRFYGGISDAPETENAITVSTKAWFYGIAYTVTPHLIVHAAYAREDRENSFIRHIMAAALSIKF